MKLLIGLALLSVAFATPIAPVTLPKAPQAFEMPDIRPLIIPQEVMEALMAAAPVNPDSLVDAVNVVDHAEEVSPLAAAEDVVDPVRFVEVAENNDDVPLDLTPLDESAVHIDHVIIVDQFFMIPEIMARGPAVELDQLVNAAENIEEQPSLNEESVIAEPVQFVDAPVLDNSQVALDEESPVIAADAVKFVDAPVLDDSQDAYDEESPAIVGDAVKFVDAPVLNDSQVAGDQLTVKVVDASMYRKLYDNPLLR